MMQNKYKVGDVVVAKKHFENIFGNAIHNGEPVKIVDITKDGYAIHDWKGLTISGCGFDDNFEPQS